MPSFKIVDDKVLEIKESCTIIIENKTANINYSLKDGDYKILIFNDFADALDIKETGSIDNSEVLINYLQLEKSDLKQNTNIKVNKNSVLNVNTTYLGANKKDIIFDLYNMEADSSVNITNNIVCLENASFSLDCIGTIVKGAKRSKCHQKSHCLTIDNPNKARVLPVLNIDENDVEASHSLSSGTIDEEVLFYMNSRGLNKAQALGLILKSYLMPSDDYYADFELGEEIKNKAIGKVDEVCSM